MIMIFLNPGQKGWISSVLMVETAAAVRGIGEPPCGDSVKHSFMPVSVLEEYSFSRRA
jgi:hypothetical protein